MKIGKLEITKPKPLAFVQKEKIPTLDDICTWSLAEIHEMYRRLSLVEVGLQAKIKR